MDYCKCGIRHRQLFNDVYSCPRCPTIVVKKDHVTMVWRGARALTLLDEFEKMVTQRLLSCREEAETTMGVKEPPAVTTTLDDFRKRLSEEHPGFFCDKKPAAQARTRECDQCGFTMEAGCGKKCAGCGWISPCSIE